MKIYARIQDQTVVELIEPLLDPDGNEHPISERFTPDIAAAIVDASAATAIAQGWSYKSGVFAAPVVVAPPLSALKSAKLLELADAFSSRIAAVKAGYPDEEVSSWPEQKAEAAAYNADKTAPTPLLASMARARGIALADLVSRVLANAAAWSVTSGALIGKRQRYEDQVAAAKNVDDVSAIVWID